jgi:putative hemolysin
MLRKQILLIASISIAACSSTPKQTVQPYGPDQFVIYTMSKSAAKAHQVAVERANKYCTDAGKQMNPVSDKKIARRQFEFRFSCK